MSDSNQCDVHQPLKRARKASALGVLDVLGASDKSEVTHPSRWRLALLIASSAALSGIGVVLWNRRALQHMREAGLRTRARAAGKVKASSEEEEFY